MRRPLRRARRRTQPATLPTCGAVSINAVVGSVVNLLLGVPDPSGIGGRVGRNEWSGAPESAVGSFRNERSGHVGTGARVRPEYAVNAIWTYEEPHGAVAAIREYVAFYPDRVDSITERAAAS